MIVKFVPKPNIKSYTLFSKAEELKKGICNSNSVRYSVKFITKTYLNISIEAGEATFKLNEPSEYSIANNIKLVTKTGWNYFHGSQSVNHYFKLTKKQNLEMLKNHIISLTEKVLSDLYLNEVVNLDTFVIEIELPNELYSQVA